MDDTTRWLVAAHAMQSGVAMEMNRRPEPTSPKHLRVGINTAHADQMGLVELLIAKGIFTRDEHMKAIADSMEQEVERYEKHLSELIGAKITLG